MQGVQHCQQLVLTTDGVFKGTLRYQTSTITEAPDCKYANSKNKT